MKLCRSIPYWIFFYLCLGWPQNHEGRKSFDSTSKESERISFHEILYPSEKFQKIKRLGVYQIVLTFPGKNSAKYQVPAQMKVVRRTPQSLILESRQGLNEQLYLQLKKQKPHPHEIREFVQVHWNADAKIEGQSTCLDCLKDPKAKLETLPQEFISNPASSQNQMPCSLTNKCSRSGVAMGWEDMMMGNDLMNEQIKKWKIPSKTRIGIMDTGLDGQTAKKFKASKIQFPSKMMGLMKDNSDDEGHGTAVASVIDHLAPGSDIIIDKQDLKDSSTFSDGLNQLCEDGAGVINLSMNHSINDIEIPVAAYLSDSFIEKGCIVIQASGNSGKKKTSSKKALQRTMDIVPHVLQVGGQGIDGTDWFLADEASLQAPSENIQVSMGENAKINTVLQQKRGGSCGDSAQAITNGTSFAAPQVTVVVKNILDILHGSEIEKSLPAKARPLLVKHILLASTVDGKSVNGYLATSLAREIADSGRLPRGGSIQDIKLYFQESPQMKNLSQPPTSSPCSDIPKCPQQKECLQQLRRHLMWLAYLGKASTAEYQKAAADLALTYHKNGEFELALPWVKMMPTLTEQDWVGLQSRWKQGAIQDLRVLAQYLSDLAKNKNKVSGKFIHQLTQEVLDQWDQMPVRSSEIYLDSDADYFKDLQTKLFNFQREGDLFDHVIKSTKAQDQDLMTALSGKFLQIQPQNLENVAMQVLRHHRRGPRSIQAVSYFTVGLQGLAFEKVSDEIMKTPEVTQDSLVLLARSLIHVNASFDQKKKVMDQLQAHPQAGEKLLFELGRSLPRVHTQIGDLKKSVQDYQIRIQKHKDWSLNLQQSVYAGTATGSVYLQSQDRLSYVQSLIQSPLASYRMRPELLVNSQGLDAKDVQSYYEVALTSSKLINPQNPLGAEEFIYLNLDQRLSDETLIDLLKKVPKGSLLPKNDLRQVMLKIRPTSQSLLSSELSKLYPENNE
jgi:hypothetical protein